LKIDEIVFEDNTFDKRDTDPKKLKKAAAAAAVEARKARKAPAPKPAANMPEKPKPVAPPPVAPVIAAEPKPTVKQAPAKQDSRKWLGLVALLALIALGLFFWNQSPLPVNAAKIETVVEPGPVNVRLLSTRQIDRPADPAQPPD
ncbi:MAG: hypothetical protein LJE56_09265, partial [Acidiferrobacterales bacterium]|nr:hypothetical protein [Acidiferrobacterales bacterium]